MINAEKYIVKIDRIAAWVLLVVVVAYGITGYGMTKGLVDPSFSRSLHFGILGAAGLIAFVIHTAWAIHLALCRHNIWNSFTKIGLAGFYILLVLFFGWVHFFYQESFSPVVSVATENNIAITSPAAKIFTAATLASFNGLNGQPAYAAVDGVVYDMSRVFRNGLHYGYSAGQDLTTAFHSEHSNSYLRGYAVVGSYKK